MVLDTKFMQNLSIEGKKKKRNTPIYFNTNYRKEMILVPIIMDYCLLQFDALKFFLDVRLQGEGSIANFNFLKSEPPTVHKAFYKRQGFFCCCFCSFL